MATRIVVGLEGDGTAYDVAIACYQLPAKGEHAFWLIQMTDEFEIDIASRLLYVEQYVVNLLYSAVECLLGIADSLFFQCVMCKMEDGY